MRTHSAKIAGRKRKEGVERYPSGQIVEEVTVEQKRKNMSVAVEARQRVYGLRARDAALQDGGSAIGRLLLEGNLAGGQQARDFAAAAEYFHERRLAYEGAIQAARLTTSTDYTGHRRGSSGGEGDDPSYVQWCNLARSKYADVRRAILECGDPLAMIALEMAILEDTAPKGEAMMGALRCGLNAVHRMIRSERRAA